MDSQFTSLPLGLAAVGLLDDEFPAGSRPLSEAEKEDILFRSKDAGSEEEAEEIRNSVPDWSDDGDLFNGPSIG